MENPMQTHHLAGPVDARAVFPRCTGLEDKRVQGTFLMWSLDRSSQRMNKEEAHDFAGEHVVRSSGNGQPLHQISLKTGVGRAELQSFCGKNALGRNTSAVDGDEGGTVDTASRRVGVFLENGVEFGLENEYGKIST